jgi:hypothetical protein
MPGRYSLHVNSKKNMLLALIAAVALIGGGCGGLGASGSVSPATFLMPGLGQTTPKAAPSQELAPSQNSTIVAHSAALVP